jgi:hypothetical protein
MLDCLPFVGSDSDTRLLRKYYSEARATRVLLPALRPTRNAVGHYHHTLWIDSGIDGYHVLLTRKRVFDTWKAYVGQFKENVVLGDPSFVEKPSYHRMEDFVFSVMDHCMSFHPAWITVPQLPVVEGTGRNRINRLLAQATAKWRLRGGFAGQLVVPIIFTHQDQLKGRTEWRNTLSTAEKCYADAGATFLWVVDSTLEDQKCRAAYGKRFDALIRFHEDLRAARPEANVIAGPYWGMNLVLWARRLCDYPAVSLGTGYRYMISGAFAKQARRFHVALQPLRRWALASPELERWLKEACKRTSEADVARVQFEGLSRDLRSRLTTKRAAKEQVARAYEAWIRGIHDVVPEGRTLALYQDLSSAYVLGKQLPSLPRSEAPGREPGKVAEQLMLHCL